MDKYFNLEEELKKLPTSPGVYLMHDAHDEIIYIGKAKNLKNRVNQYFKGKLNRGPKIEIMVSLISYFEYIVTDSEAEALILENNLIKDKRPKYNTMLMDDKTYPYIKLTVSEPFPRLIVTRKIKKDKDRCYGPYPNATAVNEITEFLRRVYKIRTCNRVLPRDIGKNRPCLNYHIGRCMAPCDGLVSEEDYSEMIAKIRQFLEGNTSSLAASLKETMLEASSQMEYEKAGEYKELLNACRTLSERQKMEYFDGDNRDVLGLAVDKTEAIMQVFSIRQGKLLRREHFYLNVGEGDDTGEIVSSFVKQYYSGTPFLPKEIHLPTVIEDMDAISEWLSTKAGRKTELKAPQKGKKEKMVELAETNARKVLETDREKVRQEEKRTRGAVSEISKRLAINYARRIEAYDISHTAGVETVGSMVVFEEGKPKKNDYRKFKIRSLSGNDDYGSMAEVLKRRFSHEEWKCPDLLLIDGGTGQVHAVENTLKEMGIENIPVCGMVKDDRHRTRGLLYNEKEVELGRDSEPFRLITRIQDEAHRFAIEYHRSLRGKGQVRSILDEIEGIGPKRRLALTAAFKSLDAIAKASVEELAAAPGMNMKAAEAVKEFFEKHPV
ncbi:MAG: excinuclease ABC subunit UvrC [Parasporobacterium sp.]|nr:excinuclease ABC subunit UvrC [Parasporobacterium sp.]